MRLLTSNTANKVFIAFLRSVVVRRWSFVGRRSSFTGGTSRRGNRQRSRISISRTYRRCGFVRVVQEGVTLGSRKDVRTGGHDQMLGWAEKSPVLRFAIGRGD